MPNANKMTQAVPGDWNIICDRTGRKVKASEVVDDPDEPSLKVLERYADEVNPQEFAKLSDNTVDSPVWTQPGQPDKLAGPDIEGNEVGVDTSAYKGTVATSTFEYQVNDTGVITKTGS